MAAAVATPSGAPPIHTKHMASKAHSCPNCGTEMPPQETAQEQKRIMELEAQIEMLKEKATAAVDRCADYEDQLRNMQQGQNSLQRSDATVSLQPTGRPSHEEARPSTANSTTARTSRFSFLMARRGSPAASTSSSTDPELLEQLAKERALRTKAEEKARKVDLEIEELSVQLFSQANEMVAAERKARAKLEARVEQLEKKDKEKVARLERLENAVSRIDRVKALLAAPSPAPVGSRKS
ncbi:hypothetical protein DM02DRAFT_346094 [Periconia macrospinosa]|uniref:GDP/GTP exchange factor Sec2 N-terminal domain-containing protein n=1 Tax=Periconia macrospinosa TaxID=97972 RepID=A0A2V1DT42_9PLEO|nr:hypothetical protein DM02DRAFT_346094 [Periconia macrospinosa]